MKIRGNIPHLLAWMALFLSLVELWGFFPTLQGVEQGLEFIQHGTLNTVADSQSTPTELSFYYWLAILGILTQDLGLQWMQVQKSVP